MESAIECWGSRDNDLIVDEITPWLIQALALIDNVMHKTSNITISDDEDLKLDKDCNIIDAQDSLIDALAACRKFQKKRLQEIEKQAERERVTKRKAKEGGAE